jgi:hypothetical protein
VLGRTSLTVQKDVLDLGSVCVDARRRRSILVYVAPVHLLGADLQHIPRPQRDVEAATAIPLKIPESNAILSSSLQYLATSCVKAVTSFRST